MAESLDAAAMLAERWCRLQGTFLMCDLATEPGLAKELGQDHADPAVVLRISSSEFEVLVLWRLRSACGHLWTNSSRCQIHLVARGGT